MTQSTDADRASLSSFIDRAGRDGFDTAHNFFDCGEVVFFNPATADLWNFWQAARRAQVVPHRLIEAAQAVIERWDSPNWKDLPATADYIARLRNALAAAPRPPEAACNPSMQPELATFAAPVQMPEACGRVSVDEDGDSEVTWRGGFPPDDRTRLYTEQQVRQLLAAHGIK